MPSTFTVPPLIIPGPVFGEHVTWTNFRGKGQNGRIGLSASDW